MLWRVSEVASERSLGVDVESVWEGLDMGGIRFAHLDPDLPKVAQGARQGRHGLFKAGLGIVKDRNREEPAKLLKLCEG